MNSEETSPPEKSSIAEASRKEKSKTIELFQIALYALLFAYIIRIFFLQAFKIPTGSMENTLLVGDLLLVNKFVYGAKTPDKIPFTEIKIPQYQLPALREPRSGDVIVFKFPPDPLVDYIKRCVAVAGQTVEIKNKIVYVDGVPFSDIVDPPGLKYEDPDIIPRDKGYETVFPKNAGSRDNYGPVKVPEGTLFAMGDNRDRSYDSRQWGFVPREYVIGKALLVYWSTASEDNFDIRWSRIGMMIE
ncbi:signal peptidase I [bacterium]|nr:signal peptidase I [bacterium]